MEHLSVSSSKRHFNNVISSHFAKIKEYTFWYFTLEVTLLAFLSRFLIVFPTVLLLSGFGVDLGKPNIEAFDFSKNIFSLLLFVIIIGPLTETFLFQLLPISLLRVLKFPVSLILVLTTFFFALAHLEEGLINFIGMVPIGFLFNWAFLMRSKRSILEAFFAVFIIHGLTNLLAIIMYILTS